MKKQTTALVVAAALVLAGCQNASPLNPHVTWNRPAGPATLATGIDYAHNAIAEYREAIGRQAWITSMLGIVLIPLSAAALGLGATGGDGNVILGLGLGGASAYGVGSWLSSKPRQRVYVEGIRAMNCAVEAVEPLAGAPSAQQLDALNVALAAATGDHTQAASALATYRKSQGEPGVVAGAELELSQAQAAIDAASTTYQAGAKLQAQAASAGQALMNAVDRIGNDVDAALISTEPDLESLSAVVAGLAKMSMQFAPIAEGQLQPALRGTAGAGAVQLQSAELDALRAALATLKGAIETLGRAAAPIAAAVNAIDAEGLQSRLHACGVDASDIPLGITVAPPGDVRIDAGKGGTRRLILSGGKPLYRTELLERPVDKLSVEQPTGTRVTIEAKPGVGVGTYTLLVEDSAGHREYRKIVVSGATEGGGQAPSASSCPSAEPDAFDASLADHSEQVYVVQRVVETVADGQIRDQTRAKICAYQKAHGLKETGRVSQALFTQLKRESDAKGGIVEGANNPYERSLEITPDVVRELQQRLGVADSSGKLDEATRKAIEAFETEPAVDRPQQKDELSPDLVKAILGVS